MSASRPVVKRYSLASALFLVGCASAAQASSANPIPADKATASLLSVTSALVALPATWSLGVAESLTLTVLGLTLVGISTLLRRVLATEAPQVPLPSARLVDPRAVVHLRRPRLSMREVQDSIRS